MGNQTISSPGVILRPKNMTSTLKEASDYDMLDGMKKEIEEYNLASREMIEGQRSFCRRYVDEEGGEINLNLEQTRGLMKETCPTLIEIIQNLCGMEKINNIGEI